MISVRRAALLEQRRRYGRYAKRKVLRPNSLLSSSRSIARRAADAELDSKIDLYNDGLISNEEFLSYLKASAANPLFTPSEKVDIQDKIRDFTTRVMVERLEANYRNTPPGSYRRVTAARDLASYYQNEANAMQAGTLAHSKALQQVGIWQGRADTEERGILKANRKAKRAELFYEAAQYEPNTVQALEAKAKAYDQLASQAEADEELTEAMNYRTYAQNIRNKIPILIEREEKAIQREWVGTIKDQLKKIKIDYHNGRINLETAAQMANQVNEAAIDAGDISTQMAVNTFADRLQKDLEKGVLRGDIEGLPTIKRGTTGAGASIREMRKVFTREDDDYRTAKRQIMLIPDALARYNALTQLQAAYVYGIKPTDVFPDGFEGLVARKQLWDELAIEYPNKNYENNSRDTQEKLDKIEYELSQNVATLENIVPGGVSEEIAKAMFGDLLSQPPDTLGTRAPGSKEQGILVSYDRYGQRYEKAIFLDDEYYETDPETGQQFLIKTKLGRDIAKVTDKDGTTKYVKLTPVNISDPTGAYPDFYQAEWQGEYIVSDPYTGEVKKAREAVEDNPVIAKWYETVKHLEKPIISPTKPEEAKPAEITRTPEGMISPVPEEDIVKPEVVKPTSKLFEFKRPPPAYESLQKVVEPVVAKAKEVYEKYKPAPLTIKPVQLKPTIEAAKTFQMKPTIEAFKQGAIDLGKGIKKTVTPLAKQYIEPLKQFQWKPTVEAFKESARGLYEKGKEKVKNIFQKLKPKWSWW